MSTMFINMTISTNQWILHYYHWLKLTAASGVFLYWFYKAKSRLVALNKVNSHENWVHRYFDGKVRSSDSTLDLLEIVLPSNVVDVAVVRPTYFRDTFYPYWPNLSHVMLSVTTDSNVFVARYSTLTKSLRYFCHSYVANDENYYMNRVAASLQKDLRIVSIDEWIIRHDDHENYVVKAYEIRLLNNYCKISWTNHRIWPLVEWTPGAKYALALKRDDTLIVVARGNNGDETTTEQSFLHFMQIPKNANRRWSRVVQHTLIDCPYYDFDLEKSQQVDHYLCFYSSTSRGDRSITVLDVDTGDLFRMNADRWPMFIGPLFENRLPPMLECFDFETSKKFDGFMVEKTVRIRRHLLQPESLKMASAKSFCSRHDDRLHRLSIKNLQTLGLPLDTIAEVYYSNAKIAHKRFFAFLIEMALLVYVLSMFTLYL